MMHLPHALAATLFAASASFPYFQVLALHSPWAISCHGSNRISSSCTNVSYQRRRPRYADMAEQRMTFDSDVSRTAIDAFHAWLTKSGVKLGDNAVLVGRSPLAGGRGLITTKAVEGGQQVLAIPENLGLTASGLKNSGIAQYLTDYEGWTGDTGLIALQILWERAQGEKSKLAPWIAMMPAAEDLDMPLFWDKEDLSLADASSTRVRRSV